MASVLVERYDDRVAAVLSCYDRAVVTEKARSSAEAQPHRLSANRGAAMFVLVRRFPPSATPRG